MLQVMWLVAEAEDALRNSTLLDLQLALDLARLQSVAYCHFPNVAAWNCSRCGHPVQTADATGSTPELGRRVSVYPACWRLKARSASL